MYKFILLSLVVLSSFAGVLKKRIKNNIELKNAPEAKFLEEIKILPRSEYTIKINHKNEMRYYKIYLPKTFDISKQFPVVFALHGGGGNMEIQSDEKYYNLISFSEENSVVMVFPNGYSKFKSGKFATWNAGTCCANARDKMIDDVDFIKEVYNSIIKKININKHKVYAIGMSNGAMMSYRLACELPNIFKAIGAVAGTDNTMNCNPQKPVSIIHFHAKNDDHVLFEGGLGPKAINKELETQFNSVDYTITKWKGNNKCANHKRRILEVKGAFCDLFDQCDKGAKVQLCVTEDGGHSWPGGTKVLGKVSGVSISANQLIWKFFESL